MILYIIVSDILEPTKNKDISFMNEALKEAEKALSEGEVPIGSVIVKDGEIVGRGYNQTEGKKDVTAHAEIVAIRDAEARLGGWRLSGTTMYVTNEPCTMCAGAILLARIDRLVIGASSPKSGACYSLKNLLEDDRLNHTVNLNIGVLENECSRLMKDFFKELRDKRSRNK